MRYQMFSIRDAKTETFFPPQFKVTSGEAERDFHALLSDPATLPGRYPGDYSMWHLGSYDAQTGEVTPHYPPTKLIDGDSLKSNLTLSN